MEESHKNSHISEIEQIYSVNLLRNQQDIPVLYRIFLSCEYAEKSRKILFNLYIYIFNAYYA